MKQVAADDADSVQSEALHKNGAARLLTADELADRWQVQKAHVYRLARVGQVPCVQIGRYYRFRLAAIEAWERDGGASTDA